MYKYLALLFFSQYIWHAQAQSFSAVVNENIPDDGTSIDFTINVSGLPDVIDTVFGLESVCINLDHTWDSDLELKLVAPDGTTFLLFTGVGGDGDNFNYTCLNGNSEDGIAGGSAPFTGSYKPMGDMGLVNNGQNPNGTWTLHVYDTYAFADEGYMYAWSLNFSNMPAKSFIFSSSNLPLVLIETGDGNIYDEPKVPADIHIIDNGIGMLNHPSDTDFAYNGKILVELQGYTGPYYPKKNYDFDIVNDAGLEIDTVLLGLPSENDFILKAEYLDLSLIKNQLTYEMSRRMGQYAPRTKYCEVFVDGQYMGVFSLTEKIKRDKNRVDIASLHPDDTTGIDLTGGYITEMNINGDPASWYSNYLPINSATCGYPVEFKTVYPKFDSIVPQQVDYIHAYTDSFENILQSADFLDSLNGYRSLISVKSFIDFMLVNEMSANYDSYGRSTFMYKDKGGQLHIGPPWDYDRAYAPWTVEGWVWQITHPYWPYPFWWSRFREDPEWRNEVYCRYTSLRENTWSTDSMLAFIDSCSMRIHDAAVRNFNVWAELGVTDYDAQVNELKQFVIDRLVWMDDELNLDYVEAPEITFNATSIADLQYAFMPNHTDAYSYLWDFGDGTFSTEMNPIHNYATSGTYTILLTANYFYGCTTTYSYTIDVVQGIINNQQNLFSVFPNPFSNALYITTIQPLNASVFIYNSIGEMVIKKKITNTVDLFINTNKLPGGLYTVKIVAGSKMYYWKVIKE